MGAAAWIGKQGWRMATTARKREMDDRRRTKGDEFDGLGQFGEI